MSRGPSELELSELARLIAATAEHEVDCETFGARVAEFLERRRGSAGLPADLEMLRQHMAVCPECREEFDLLTRAVDESPG